MELFSRLDAMGVKQIIYVPEKKVHPDGTNDFGGENTVLVSSRVIRPYHSYAYFIKINVITKDVESRFSLSEIGCCFATNLFSDGGVAYKLKKKYGIPYIVAVRTTDVNFFLKVPHMWPVARKILNDASKVIFIGPAIQNKLFNHFVTVGIKESLKEKSILLPNGINKFWLDHLNNIRKEEGHSVIYVGRFMKNKNIENLIKAILLLRKEIPDVQLCLVGGGGELESEIIRYADLYKGIVVYKGRVDDKEELLKIYRDNNIFAMISKRETFGLVYVEALSQGLPILYTKGQGIDGFFSQRVGEGVNPSSVKHIKNALKNLLINTNDYSLLAQKDFEHFDWDNIAKEYFKIISLQ